MANAFPSFSHFLAFITSSVLPSPKTHVESENLGVQSVPFGCDTSLPPLSLCLHFFFLRSRVKMSTERRVQSIPTPFHDHFVSLPPCLHFSILLPQTTCAWEVTVNFRVQSAPFGQSTSSSSLPPLLHSSPFRPHAGSVCRKRRGQVGLRLPPLRHGPPGTRFARSVQRAAEVSLPQLLPDAEGPDADLPAGKRVREGVDE